MSIILLCAYLKKNCPNLKKHTEKPDQKKKATKLNELSPGDRATAGKFLVEYF